MQSPGLRGAHKMVGFIADARCELQSLGTAASSPARVGNVKWLGGRPPVRQTGRGLAELHCVVVDAATFAAVVFDDHVALGDGVPTARSSAVRACRTTLECVAFFVRMARMSALLQRIIATSAGRPERPKTPTQSEVAGPRGVGAQILGTFRYCCATLHVRDFRRIAAVTETVVRCMWPEKAQAMMKELYDDGVQHPGKSTLLRARIRLDITSMLLRRRWFNSDRWHLQPWRSLHLLVDASPITGREVLVWFRDIYSGGLILAPIVDAAGLAGLWNVTCTDKTMALLPSLWLSCGGGAVKTFEDVLLSIKSITTDMDGRRGKHSNRRSRSVALRGCREAPCVRHVSGVPPLVATVHASRLASPLGWGDQEWL